MASEQQSTMVRMPISALLGWIVPGLGHIYLGHRGRGLVFLVTITATFWTGVAIGGVKATVDPQTRKLWFFAQLCTAGNTATAYAMHRAIVARETQTGVMVPKSFWASVDVGVHYTGVAGLLNLLVVFDAIGRSEVPSPVRPRRRGKQANRGNP